MGNGACDRLCLGAATVWVTLAACVTEPIQEVCPALASGDLVIDEVNQRYLDANQILSPAFVELVNVSGGPVSLFGARLRMRNPNSTTDVEMIARDADEIPDGGYFVLGFNDPEMAWPGIDFGVGDDYLRDDVLKTGLEDPALLSLEVCDVQIDQVIYDGLPEDGSWSLGVTPPDAEANDDPENWCVDAEEPTTGSLRGTPGEANRPCD